MNPMKKPPMIPAGYYAPLVLANGTDFLQIDFSGSMTFKNHINGCMPYWFKKGRPQDADPLALVRLSYGVHSDVGPVELADFDQDFDPASASVVSRVTAHQYRLRLTSFLTEDHVFVELFQIEDCSAAVPHLTFSVSFNKNTYQNVKLASLSRLKDALQTECRAGMPPVFRYRIPDGGEVISGFGISVLKMLSGSGEVTYPENTGAELVTHFRNFQSGDVFVRLSCVTDTIDDIDPEQAARASVLNYAAMSEAELRSIVTGRKAETGARSQFHCDDEAFMRQYDISRFVCRSVIHHGGSAVTEMTFPGGHGMGTYFDIWNIHRGLLAANDMAEAGRILNFWKLGWPEARRLAREKYGVNGARYAWVLDYRGRSFREALQIHNNLIPVINVWDMYCYTGDVQLLRDYFVLMTECIQFILEFALFQDEAGDWRLRELISVDESLKMKRDDLLTTFVTWRAIQILHAAATLIHQPVPAVVGNAEPAIESIKQRLTETDGLCSYEGAETRSWASLFAFIHVPDPVLFSKSIDDVLMNCAEADGLGIGRSSRMRCATFPWVEGLTAWAMARNNDIRALDWLRHMIRRCNYYGGLPEYVWINGQASRDWYVDGHAVFLCALSEMLARVEGRSLQVLPLGLAALESLGDFSITNLRVPIGLGLSMRVQSGKVTSLEVLNLTDADVAFEFSAPGMISQPVQLASEERIKLLCDRGEQNN